MGRIGTKKEEEYVSKHSRRSLWLKIVGLFAVIVLCGTVRALILPAVTESITDGMTDISGFVDCVNLYKAENGEWVPATSFSESDNAKMEITFDKLTYEMLEQSDGVVQVYIPFPEGVSPSADIIGVESEFSDPVYGRSGSFHLDENGMAVIAFKPDYLAWVKENNYPIKGGIEFEFIWDLDQIEDNTINLKDVYKNLPDEDVTIIVIPNEDNSEKNKYSLSKWKDWIEASEGSKDGYVYYYVQLEVKQNTEGPIILNDSFPYPTKAYGVSDLGLVGVYDENWKEISDLPIAADPFMDNQTSIVLGDEGATIDSGTYRIKYKVRVEDLYALSYEGKSLYNEVSVVDGDTVIKKSCETNLPRGSVNKAGTVKDSDDGIVEWTVWINDGGNDGITSYLENVVFKDTLEAGTSYNGDLKVYQYDPNNSNQGRLLGDSEYTLNYEDTGDEFTVALPDGRYYYKITYTTTTDLTDVPDGTNYQIKNACNVGYDGNIIGEGRASVNIQKTGVFKESTGVSDEIIEVDGRSVVTVNWKSTIAKVNAESTYYDLSAVGYGWGSSGSYSYELYMNDAQRNAIKVTYIDADGKTAEAEKTDYQVELYQQNDTYTKGLFQITFPEDSSLIGKRVFISYETYADLTNVPGNTSERYTNYFGTDTDKATAKAEVKNTKIQSLGYIKKYTPQTQWWNGGYNMGISGTVDWVIQVDGGKFSGGDLTITDTLPAGMEVSKDDIRIRLDYYSVSAPVMDAVYYEIREVVRNSDGTSTITIVIKEDGYKGKYFYVCYPAKVTDEEFLAGAVLSKNFENIVTAKTDTVSDQTSHDVTVNREVVGKNGSYNYDTRTLNYEVVVNPDSSVLLGEGQQLVLEDVMKDNNDWLEFVGVAAYTVATNFSGEKVAGSKIRNLTPAAAGTENYEDWSYTYTKNQDSHTLKAYVPDKTGFVLVYSYRVKKNLASTITFNNKAILYGKDGKQYETSTGTAAVKYSLNAWVETESDKTSVVLRKHSSKVYSDMLRDAVYALSAYKSDGTWSDSNKYTTGELGTVRIVNLEYDTLYRLVEDTAPVGYVLDETPHYFVVVKDNTKTVEEVLSELPEGVTYEDIERYTASSAYIDLFDEEDTTGKTPKTSITVTKKWFVKETDPETGAETVTATENPGIDTVMFELYQAAAKTQLLDGIDWWDRISISNKYSLKDGETVQFSVLATDTIVDPNVTIEISDGKSWIDSNLGHQTNSWIFESDKVVDVVYNEGSDCLTQVKKWDEEAVNEETGEKGAYVFDTWAVDLEKSHKYTATITRSGNVFTIRYDDLTADEWLYTVTVAPDSILDADNTNAYIIVQRGSYAISAQMIDGYTVGNTNPISAISKDSYREPTVTKGTLIGSYKISEKEKWTITIDDLDAVVEDTKCAYYIEEIGANKYDAEYENNTKITAGEIGIKNYITKEDEEKPENENTTLSVRKQWYESDRLTPAVNIPEDISIAYALYRRSNVLNLNGNGSSENDAGMTFYQAGDSFRFDATVWWSGQYSPNYILKDGDTVKFQVDYLEVVEADDGLTVEVSDGYLFVDSNFAREGTGHEWVANDIQDPIIISDLDSFRFQKGHKYSVTVSRNGNMYKFRYYDETEKEECYTVYMITASTLGDSVVRLIGQKGVFDVTAYYARNNTESTYIGTAVGNDEAFGNRVMRTGSVPLNAGETKEIYFVSNGEDLKAEDYITFEILGNEKYVDSNFGCFTNAWSFNFENETPISFYDNQGNVSEQPPAVVFEKGHTYLTEISRSADGMTYTFTYYDVTDEKVQLYKAVVETSEDCGAADLYAIVQAGSYTVGIGERPVPANVEPTEEEKAATAGLYDVEWFEVEGAQYILNSSNQWEETFENLPSVVVDEEAGTVTYYEYYVMETDTGGGTWMSRDTKITPASETANALHEFLINNSLPEEEPGYELPMTGGPGTRLYTLGAMLAAAAMTLLMYRKLHAERRGNKKSSQKVNI